MTPPTDRPFRLVLVLLACAVAGATAAIGCAGKGPAAGTRGPTTEPAGEATAGDAAPADPGEPPPPPAPPPVTPAEALAYLDRVLRDDSRLVEVFTNETQSGVLDDYGRKKLRAALPKWWQSVALDKAGRPTQVVVESPNAAREGPGAAGQGTVRRAVSAGEAARYAYLPTISEMGIRIYAKGSAKATAGVGPPVVSFQIFQRRNLSKVTIADPDQERLSEPVYVIDSPDPVAWVGRVFAGKL